MESERSPTLDYEAGWLSVCLAATVGELVKSRTTRAWQSIDLPLTKAEPSMDILEPSVSLALLARTHRLAIQAVCQAVVRASHHQFHGLISTRWHNIFQQGLVGVKSVRDEQSRHPGTSMHSAGELVGSAFRVSSTLEESAIMSSRSRCPLSCRPTKMPLLNHRPSSFVASCYCTSISHPKISLCFSVLDSQRMLVLAHAVWGRTALAS